MDGLTGAFENLTAPQAEVISAAVTLVSALVVALVAPVTFHLLTRRGVKGFHEAVADLKEAAGRAREQSNTIGHTMGTIAQVSSRVNELGILLASVQETLANTQNTLLENRADVVENAHTQARDRIKALWRGLQEMVERIAARPSIHGHTRARFARIDRRGYLKLIGALLDERHLAGSIDDWKSAYYLWTGAQRAAAEPTAADVDRMEGLERLLREANASGDGVEAAAVPPQQPTLSPGVMMTPPTSEAATPKSHARATLAKAPTSPRPPQDSGHDQAEQRPT